MYENIPVSFKEDDFISPPKEFSPIYAWVWNGKLSHEETDRQLEEMKRLGIKAVYIIPEPKEFRPESMPTELEPGYLTEGYFEEYIYALKSAKNMGMYCWLYDEGGWPSGSACGRVVSKYPETKMRGVRISSFSARKGDIYKKQNPDTIAAFTDKINYITEGYVFPYDTCVSEYYEVLEETREPDSTKEGTTERFLEITHNAYKSAIGDEFDGLVKAVFTDEPGAPSLTPELFEEYEHIYGESVLPFLPYIGFVVEPTEQAANVMEKWFDLCSKKFCDNYLKKCKKWSNENNTLFTGHMNVDDSLDGWKIGRHYNIMRALRCMDIPGIDVIWRQIFPGKTRVDESGISVAENRLFPRYASSAAAQNGTKFAMSETFGVFGSGTTFDEMRFTAGFQTIRGINIINPMVISYLRKAVNLAQEQPIFIENFACYKLLDEFNSYLQRLCFVSSLGERVCDTALYYPIHNLYRRQDDDIITREYEELGRKMDENRIDFDIIDDDIFNIADGIDEGCICIGDSKYTRIVVAPHSYLPESTKSALKRFAESGGMVVSDVESLPCVFTKIMQKNVRLMRRNLENGKLFIFFNEGDETVNFDLSMFEGNAYNLCLESGQIFRCKKNERLSLVCGETAVIFETNDEFESSERKIEFENEIELKSFNIKRKSACILKDDDCVSIQYSDEQKNAQLGDWSEFAGKKYSGSCIYTTEFAFDKIPNDDVLVDLGKVCYACEINLNGNKVCRKLVPPFRFVLPKEYLKENNVLEITIYNTMANEFIYTDLFNKYETCQLSPYFEKEMVFMKDSLESGLFGPVHIYFNN